MIWGLRLAMVPWVLAAGVPARAHDPVRVPMPVDVAPHHRGFLAGEHHFDITNHPEVIHHAGGHFVSYGRHNYDISDDPSIRDRYPFETLRFRGSGRGLDRVPLLQWSPGEFDRAPERPWVVTGIGVRGLRYRSPADERTEPPRFDRPVPSYYAAVRRRPDGWERAVRGWDLRWVPGLAASERHGRRRRAGPRAPSTGKPAAHTARPRVRVPGATRPTGAATGSGSP